MADRFHLVHEIVMIYPVNPNLHEGEQIEKDGRQHRSQTGYAIRPRHLQFQHHDGDYDSDDTVGECLETVRTQSFSAHSDTTLARRQVSTISTYSPW